MTEATLSHIATIVVTYNGEQWLDRCFGALRKQGLAASTIVVDNGSTDSTVQRLRTDFPEVTIHEAGQNLGFGAANNLALELAVSQGYQYFFLLNQDAWPLPGCLPDLLDVLETNPNIGITSPLHLQADELTLDVLFGMYLQQAGQSIATIGHGFAEVPFVNAAAWLLPLRTLERVGGFNPLFYHYGEDRDYAARAFAKTVQIAVVGSARLVHDRGARRVGWGNDNARQLQAYQRGLSIRLADANNTDAQALRSVVDWSLRNAVSALRVGAWRQLVALPWLMVQVLAKAKSYRSAAESYSEKDSFRYLDVEPPS